MRVAFGEHYMRGKVAWQYLCCDLDERVEERGVSGECEGKLTTALRAWYSKARREYVYGI